MTTPDAAVAEAFRRDWGRVLSAVARTVGDLDVAEDATQEAFAAALPAWRRDGVPDVPRAWLITTARNRAVDRLRRARVGAAKLRELAAEPLAGPDDAALGSGIADDRLRLLYTCCHPALALESRVTLALRTLCGLSTAEIARTFLVPEATMAKRLVRTKRKIAQAGIPYRVPRAHLLPERTAAVRQVVYLMFHEGYAATAGPDLVRGDVCDRAVELAGLLTALTPDDPETAGLHALLLLLDARRAARTDDDGVPVPLEEQDRSRWDAARIGAGLALVRDALRHERAGPYQLQALIAACHATAPAAADTDWAQIVRLYDRLVVLVPSSTVRLNRAVAVAMRDGPAAGLLLIDEILRDGELMHYHLAHSARADLCRRLGRVDEARAGYERALALARQASERRFLERRLAELVA